jgi:hypothetical protein
MAIVLWSTAVSLDGFIAGPDGAPDWVFRFTGPGDNADASLQPPGPFWLADEPTTSAALPNSAPRRAKPSVVPGAAPSSC